MKDAARTNQSSRPQGEIVVCIRRPSGPQSPQAVNKLDAIDGELSDTVTRQQQVGREVRLEAGGPPAAGIRHVLVSIKQLTLRVGGKSGHHLLERRGWQRVARVEKANEFAAAKSQAGLLPIGVARRSFWGVEQA